MGFLDFFRLHRPKQQLSSEQLRDQLFAAFRLADPSKFEAMLNWHHEQIVREIRQWRQAPLSIRQDKREMNFYVQMFSSLLGFLENTGHQQLVAEFAGPDENNPLRKWDAILKQSVQLSNQCQHDDAIELLTNALIDHRELVGPGITHFNALTHGTLGHCYYESGKVANAKGHYEQALRLCQDSSDEEGISVYVSRLYETHRWLGESSLAADYALRRADMDEEAGRADGARYMRSQANIVRAGEPLIRMIMSFGDAVYEIDEAPPITDGKDAEVLFARNRPALRLCTQLTEKGVEHAQADRMEDAMASFREAFAVDPYDPDPHHKAGFALLRAERYPEAVEQFEQVEQLGPGWFNSGSNLWLAHQLALGNLPHATFLGLWYLEDSKASHEEKLKIADGMIRETPVPLAHLFRGEALRALRRNSEAADAFKAGLALDPDPDARSRLKAQLAGITEDRALKLKLIEEAQEPGGNLGAATFARILLRQNT